MKTIRCRAMRGYRTTSLVFLALVSVCLWGRTQTIQFRPGQALSDGAATLLPGTPGSGYAIPCVADWDGDGREDLLVGYQSASKIALYLNSGTDARPSFTNFTNLRTTQSTEICHPSGGCGAPAPWVCDFDGDGKQDLLVGSGVDGTVWFYRNTSFSGAPSLAPGTQLRAADSLLSVGMRATPFVTDWDEDGLPDLLCGSGDGYAYFFRNTNTRQSPSFAKAVRLKAAGADLFLGIRSVLRVFDLDGDGLKDLVCSSDSGVYWCRNTNSNSNPILQRPESLSAPVAGRGLVSINTGGRMRLDLADWNNDGVVDLVLGNLNGTVNYFEGYRFRVQSVRQIADQIALAWDSAPFLNYELISGSSPDLVTDAAITNLPSGGTVTSWTIPATGTGRYFRVRIRR